VLLKEIFAVPQPILVTAHTNVAVDLIVQKCALAGVVPLRFGNLSRIKAELHKHSYVEKLADHRFQYRLQARVEAEQRCMDRIAELRSSVPKPAYGSNVYEANIQDQLQSKEQKKVAQELGTALIATTLLFSN
jgi:hypothetical protein